MSWWPPTRPSRALRQEWISVWHLAWPLILSNITVPLLGLVDTAILGHLPQAYFLSAAAIGSQIFAFIFFSFGFLRMGTTGLLAQAYGGRDWVTLSTVLVQGLLLAITIGLAINLTLWLWLEPAIAWIGGGEQTQQLARLYCQIRFLGAPASLGNLVITGALLAVGKTRVTLALLVLNNGINIVLDWLLTVHWQWQIAGVAWATVIANVVALAVGFYALRRLLAGSWFWPGWHRVLNWPRLLRLFRINGHIFIRTLLLIAVFVMFTRRGAQLGDTILAANSVLFTFFLLLSNGLDGFANAAEIKVGQALGRARSQALTRAVLAAGGFSIIVAIAYALLYLLLGNLLLQAITDLEGVREQAREYLPWMVLMPFTTVLAFLMDGVFIGATATRTMHHTMLICTGLVFLPLYLFWQTDSNHALWAALNLFMLARGITLLIAYQRQHRQWIRRPIQPN